MAQNGGKIIFDVIDRPPTINNSNENQDEHQGPIEEIYFENVTFSYPSRPDVEVLKNVSFKVKAGETVALIGSSGSGKSTIVQLVQRFYDVMNGKVLVSGNDIKKYKPSSIRSEISIVGQEPVLFDGSIKDNILLGRVSNGDDFENMRDVVEAAKRANAEEFIDELPQKYETVLGSCTQLSGGQKQRIAIARALIKPSSVLLLDEATSALDAESEDIVQATIDKELGRRKRITLIVAHRLATIKNVTRILAFQNGSIVEEGNHQELMSRKGVYFKLYQSQNGFEGGENLSNNESIDETRSSKRSYGHVTSFKPKRQSVDLLKKPKRRLSNSSPAAEKTFSIIRRLFEFCSINNVYLVGGCFCSIIHGLWIPMYATLIGQFAQAIKSTDTLPEEAIEISLTFFISGLIFAFSSFGSGLFFGAFSSNLVHDLRSSLFVSMIHQPIAWFEKKENNVGSLTCKIISDVDSIGKYIKENIPMMVSSLSMVITCLVIAFSNSWFLTLSLLAMFPSLFIAPVFGVSDDHGSADRGSEDNDDNGNKLKDGKNLVQFTIQVVDSIKTITSLNQQEYFLSRYDEGMIEERKTMKRSILKRAILIAWSKTSPCFINSILFFLTSYWISAGDLQYTQYVKISEGLMYAYLVLAEEMVHALGMLIVMIQ